MSKVADFVKASNKRLRDFQEANPNAPRFIRPDFSDSSVQERMMRVGIEARYCGAESEDEVFMLAVATLQDDHIKCVDRGVES